jgi:hypothetical protein
MTISDSLLGELLKNNLSKTAFQVLLFLMSCTGPVSTADISAAVGVKKKSTTKSIRRLVDAGIIQPGDLESRRRRFIIPGTSRGDAGESPGQHSDPPQNPDMNQLIDRIGRLEDMITMMLSATEKQADSGATHSEPPRETPGAVQAVGNPSWNAVLHQTAFDGHIQGAIVSHSDPPVAMGQSIGAVVIPETVVQDTPMVHLYPAASFASLFNKSKLAADDDKTLDSDFSAMFGVSLPAGSDRIAAAEMVRRKRAGKLDAIKSPIGYLASLSGKISPPSTPQSQHQQATPLSSNSQTICGHTGSLNTMQEELSRRADLLWIEMTDDERMPFIEDARNRHPAGKGGFKVPLNLLARAAFKRIKFSEWGVVV